MPEQTRGIGQSKTVLAVDDDPLVLGIIRRALTDHGHDVMAYSDSTRAAQRLRDHRLRIDILLTDIAMPNINGPELAKLAREHHAGIRILFLSGFVDVDQQTLADARLLIKPFTPSELCAFVDGQNESGLGSGE